MRFKPSSVFGESAVGERILCKLSGDAGMRSMRFSSFHALVLLLLTVEPMFEMAPFT